MKNNFLKRLKRYSISKKLTLNFIIFGFILGYLIFIIATILTTKYTLNFFRESIIKPQFQELLEIEQPDVILEIINNKDAILANKSFAIYKLLYEIDNIENVYLDYFDPDLNRFRELNYSKVNNNFYINDLTCSQNPRYKKIIKIIENKHHSNSFTFSNIYFGKADKKTMIVNLTRPIDKNKYFLTLVIKRHGIMVFIKQNFKQFILFDILLLIISIILGKIFSIKFSNPLKKLMQGASEIASGNYNYRVDIKCNDEIGSLADSLNSMTNKIQSNINEIHRNLKTMETMNKIDKAVLSSISRSDLLVKVVGIVSSLFKDTEIIILIRNYEKKGFDILSFSQDNKFGLLKNEPFLCENEVFNKINTKMHRPFQMNKKINKDNLFEYIEYFSKHKIGSFLNMPIFMTDKYYGSLIMTKHSNEGFLKHEVDSTRMLADQVCVALQSVKNFEEKETLLLGIMLALTKSIDAKSKWTAGHSERVAKYAEEIGISLGMNEPLLRQLTISAILHDIGKIGVPEYILDKPAKLTAEEYNIIKQHPSNGAKIISDIPSYKQILPGILYHHEHWDGTGYPEGLKAKDIPLNARIITVADVFDAIIDDRPYRKGMNLEEAFKFLKNQRGKLFDGELAELFLKYLETVDSSKLFA